MTKGSTTWTYTYDANGMRTKRTNGTDTYKYVYCDGMLVNMTYNNSELYFTFNPNGTPLAVVYQGASYIYATNLQGDVVAILNTSGTKVVTYAYDAWGNVLSVTGSMKDTLGKINPIRYRGYVYDHETGLYYLQSRYYDPEIGRFINADAFASTGQGITGNNMFAYCGNNPIMFVDRTGTYMERINTVLENILEITRKVVRHVIISFAASDSTALAVAQTIYGEAGGRLRYDDWEEGQRAVAYTIINRHNESGKDWYTIVSAPQQYTGYAGGKYKYQTGDLDPISWDYSLLLAGYMVLGSYDKISMPEGFTDKHKYFRADEGQSYVEWGGIRRIAGNVFFYYVSEMGG